jgi:hypothetical protein
VKPQKLLLLALSHLAVLALGFALGVYLLPVLVAPTAPSGAMLQDVSKQARFEGVFHRSLKDSDFLHWGEGRVRIGPQAIVLQGRLAPGPDYKLYLSPEFVETEADFARLKPRMVRVGDVRTFENFVVPVPAGVDVAAYTTVVVWCESFGQFITAARYR